MKIKDVWGKVKRAFSPTEVVQKHQQERAERDQYRAEAKERILDVSNFRWIHLGLSRQERRSAQAQLNKLIRPFLKPDGTKRTDVTPPKKVAARIAYLQFQLKNSPKNTPATRDSKGVLMSNNPIYAAFAQARGMQVVQ